MSNPDREQRRVVLVTGTTSGMGEATATLLASRGYRVFGGDLTPEPTGHPAFTRHRLDVRSDEEVRAFVDHVLHEAGTIDAVVNNAGYALAGAIEEATIEEAIDIFQTNFFGVARMVKTVLPILRAKRCGTVINISSGAAQVAEPYAGYYSATKFAVEGFTEALRMEVREFGLHAVLVVPGWTNTGILKHGKDPARGLDAYSSTRHRVVRAVEEFIAAAPPPAKVAKTILKILETSQPRLRYRVGKDVTTSFWTKRFTPASLYERLVRSYYKLDDRPALKLPPNAGD